MSSKYSHDQVLQSIQPFRKKYKAISLSTAITMELEDLMEQKGISKKELAAAAGVSPSYLSQVFSGDKLINISMLAGISNEFNVVFRVEIQDKKSEENGSLVEQMNDMTMKPNQEVIEWHQHPLYPETSRCCIVECTDNCFYVAHHSDIDGWLNASTYEQLSNVKSWAYLPIGANHENAD